MVLHALPPTLIRQYLSLTRTDRVLTVEFNSGNKVNSLNHALMRELTQLALELQEDSELNAIVLSGRQDIFSGGMDLMDPELATKVAAMPPLPVRMAKRAINASANALNEATSFMDADKFLLTQGMDDAMEGAMAFIEKRTPEFKGN